MTCTHLEASLIDAEEMERLHILNRYEEDARTKGYQLIAGIDEAGRGPLAGPVVAAACIIPVGVYIPKINDSKKLSPKSRQELFDYIASDKRIVYALGIIDSTEIDKVNIYQATIRAMLMAVSQLDLTPDFLLIDGMQLPMASIPGLKIIKGDALSQSIAAASVLAKVTRDHLMLEFHKRWPHYGFNQHKGYGTAKHLEALQKFGPCEIHRRSFEPVRTQVQKLVIR